MSQKGKATSRISRGETCWREIGTRLDLLLTFWLITLNAIYTTSLSLVRVAKYIEAETKRKTKCAIFRIEPNLIYFWGFGTRQHIHELAKEIKALQFA